MLTLNIAGNDVPWSHPLVPVFLSLGTLLLATFIYVELLPSRKPLVPVRLFSSRALWSIAGVTFFKEMALMAVSAPKVSPPLFDNALDHVHHVFLHQSVWSWLNCYWGTTTFFHISWNCRWKFFCRPPYQKVWKGRMDHRHSFCNSSCQCDCHSATLERWESQSYICA